MTRPSLDEQGCERIHEAALRLLGDVGCVVLDPEALDLLKAHGAVVDGECVRFGEELVAQALATVPAGYTVAGRRPELDLRVALDAPPVLASASGPPFVLDGGRAASGHASRTCARPSRSRISRPTSRCWATAWSLRTCPKTGARESSRTRI